MINFGENILKDRNEYSKFLPSLIKIKEKAYKNLKVLIKIKNKGIYEIIFEDYILYQVRNESFCVYYSEEIRKGDILIIFEKSNLLERLSKTPESLLIESHKQQYRHYGIYCEDHIIDIVAFDEPKIIKKFRAF